MKNELGIEVCCENCKHCTDKGRGCGIMEMPNDGIFNTRHCAFSPSKEAYEARIKELQEQQFTNEELQFIKDRLDECIEEWNVPDMVFMAHKILKKIEQTLKNSAENLNKQQ